MAVLGRKKTCPDCAERVAAAAKVCHFCGYRFADEAADPDEVPPAQEEQIETLAPGPKAAPAQSADAPGIGVESEDEIARHGPPKSLRGWAIAASLGLGAIGLAIAWNILADLDQLDLVDKFMSTGGSEAARADYNNGLDKIDNASLAYLGAYVAGGILFIGFFHAAYTNVARLGGRGLRFRFGQAIWPWFVPVFNLIRPKQVANDIWRGSHSLDRTDPKSWRRAPVSPLVHWWWALYIVGGIGAQASGEAFSNAEPGSEAVRSALRFVLVTLGVELVALALAFVVVYQVTRAQQRFLEEGAGGS